MEKLLLTVSESASFSGLSKSFIRELVHNKKVKYMKSGVKFLIERDSIIDYLNSQYEGKVKQ